MELLLFVVYEIFTKTTARRRKNEVKNNNNILTIMLLRDILIYNTLCTAYKSTVQTEQAMNVKFMRPGRILATDNTTSVGQ